jgi:ribokinase
MGLTEAHDIMAWMLDNGAKVAALRMGERGSLVAGQGMGRNEYLSVPPTPVRLIVDQTGAGNSYCGGFLVGYHRTGDIRLAACHGAVSASFTLEAMGLADPARTDLIEVREARYQWMLNNTA